MTTLHIGKHRTQVVTASDGSTPSGVTAVSDFPGLASVAGLTVTGVAQGSCSVTYSAPGYQSATQFVQVSPLPTLIVTDGPEV